MNALLASLKAAGISDKDIQTTNYSVYIEGTQMPSEPTSGPTAQPALIYHVSNQVQVVVRDVSKLSDVLDESVSSGANSIYGVSFDVSDPTKLADQARTMAVADAKARAEKLAQLEGLSLGNVITVTEISNTGSPVYGGAALLGKGGGGAPVEGGSIQVSISVQVTYAIK